MLAARLKEGSIDEDGAVIDGDASAPLTQTDVREFQLAKAAVRVGIDLVLKRGRVDAHRIESFCLVGAFGTHLDGVAARGIGLFPTQLPDPTPPVSLSATSAHPPESGELNNAALIGAIMVAAGARTALEGTVIACDLAQDASMMDAMLDALALHG
jgi:hypothetical protein